MLNHALAVAVGGALGALARYGAGLLGAVWFGRETWITTLLVNVAGSFALGMLFGLVGRRSEHLLLLQSALGVGFLGAFTTFSTYAVQTLGLWQEGRIFIGITYAVGSVVAALLAAWCGMRLTMV